MKLQHKLERVTEELERRKSELESSKSVFEKEKKQMGDKLETTKRKLAESQDEAMKQKLDFGRE